MYLKHMLHSHLLPRQVENVMTDLLTGRPLWVQPYIWGGLAVTVLVHVLRVCTNALVHNAQYVQYAQ